jgi:hypothetical protein
VKDLVRQNGDLVFDMLWSAQPMKANERICDLFGAFLVVDEPCRRIQRRLKTACKVGKNADQHTVAVVQSGMNQGDHERLKRGRWQRTTDLAQLTKRNKTPRYRSLNVRTHQNVRQNAKYSGFSRVVRSESRLQ